MRPVTATSCRPQRRHSTPTPAVSSPGDYSGDGYQSWYLPFERPGLRWPAPWPEGDAWLEDGIRQLEIELDAVAALVSLRSDPRVELDQAPAARMLVSSVDHLMGGAPTIDWRIMLQLVDDLSESIRSRSPVKGDAGDVLTEIGLTRDLVARTLAYEG
jgi:hypothetical protein